jgi:hypothetical protein
MPNSYSLRICSNNSTFDLESNEFLHFGLAPESEHPFVSEGGPNQNAELGHFKIPKSSESGFEQGTSGICLYRPPSQCSGAFAVIVACVFRFGLHQDQNIRVSILPEREEGLVGGLCVPLVSCHPGAGELETRQRCRRIAEHNARVA